MSGSQIGIMIINIVIQQLINKSYTMAGLFILIFIYFLILSQTLIFSPHFKKKLVIKLMSYDCFVLNSIESGRGTVTLQLLLFKSHHLQLIVFYYQRMQEEPAPKPIQNLLDTYTLNIQLPFIINPPIFRKSHRYQRDGHWNEKQRLKYSVFLTFFRSILQDALQKKKIRVYQMMSDMIITRNPNQCRSHHQKMEKYRSTIPQIIASVSQKYQPTIYKELSQKYMTLIKGLLDNQEKYKRNMDTAETNKKTSKKLGLPVAPAQQKQTQQKMACIDIEHQKQQGQEEERNEENEIEQVQECKKGIKKTAAEYSQQNQNGEDEQGVPVMRVTNMKEQDENESDEREDGSQLIPHQQNNSIFVANPFILDNETRFCYEQQLLALELKKQWHAQNADQFYNQWNNEMQNMKYCEENIKFFKQVLDQNPL